MIDLNQELEDFDAYFFKRHGELPLDPSSEEYANKSYLKHEMFKAWKARAKAQAVPEGYCLVPKEPTEVMERAGFDKGAGFLANSIYKAMVEASESGAEQ
ncbi:hypothetical protein RFH07_14650 [Acinetobacter seifertii]|uniref:hypothetical protein n=1 Tax=Acinetobacter seifertii TaxID=1530123 RepID=UPI00280E2C4E|nr:hypothetical protein [Acinetobacter seifertii]MDQ9037838.1 hypothetical protein [Acinetobacter seifertii]